MITKKRIFRCFFPVLLLSAVFFTGCTSLDKELLQEPKNFEELEPLKLEPGIEPFDLRIDVKRQSRTESAASQTEARSMTVELPYSPVGFHIGNGIFVDTNFNVCLDVLELFGLDALDDFTIQQTFANAMKKPLRYAKEGDEFVLTVGKGGGKRIEADFGEGEIEVERTPGSNYEIVREDDELAIVPTGVLTGIEKHTITGGDDEYRLKKPLKKIYITKNKGTLSFGDEFSVEMRGNAVIITYLNREEFRLVRVGGDFYFFDKSYIGFRISREGNVISVSEKGREQSQYMLE